MTRANIEGAGVPALAQQAQQIRRLTGADGQIGPQGVAGEGEQLLELFCFDFIPVQNEPHCRPGNSSPTKSRGAGRLAKA